MNKKVHVKKGDTVMLITGSSSKKSDKDKKGDRGKKGKVLAVSPKEGKVIVEGINMVTKHVRPRKMGEPGGIVKAEGAIYASKVMIVCPKCGKPTRIGHKVYPDGTKDRICRQKGCGETL